MRIGVTWKLVFAYSILLALILMLAICLSGCGTRKTVLNSSTHKTEQKDKTETKEDSGSKTEEKEVKEDSSTHDNKNDITTVETTKKYDGDGKLIEEHTKTITDKSTSKSTSTSKSVRTLKKTTLLKIRTTTYHLQIITTKTKKKDVVADKSVVSNVGGTKVVIILGVLSIVAVFLWFFLKRK